MPTPTSFKPFLKEQPRVRYDHLEQIENETSYDNEDAYHYHGKPFNGIAWNENRGVTTEDTLREGVRNGRCVKIYANGQLAEDGVFKDDEPVGEAYKWYVTGILSQTYKYNDNSRLVLHRRYSPNGILTFESDRQHVRHWTSEGVLMHECLDGVDRYYAPNGLCVIEIAKKGGLERSESPVYQDKELYLYSFDMLTLGFEMGKTAIFRWLLSKLDEEDSHAYELLMKLLDHPLPEVAMTALSHVGNRGYKAAVPKIRFLKEKNRRRLNEVFQAAILAEARLTGEGNTDKLMRGYWKDVAKLQKAEELRKLKVKKEWPHAEAYLLETIEGSMSRKSADQLFSDKPIANQVEYMHVYRYVVNNRSYRATFCTTEEKPLLVKTVRYRRKNPAEYIFDNV